jgi:RHS repeat-associated protein
MGSTRLVMDGTAVERHDFEPYGAELSGGWRTAALGYGSATLRQRFTGQERDDDTTLDYFLARYYSGTQGRFGSPDPGNAGANPGDPQSWNGYAYVSGNPLTYTDPSGMLAQAGGGDSGITGAIATAFADALSFLIGGGSHPNLSNIAWTPTPSAFDTNPALLSYTWFSPYSITSIYLSFGDALSVGSLDDAALDTPLFHAVALGAQHAKKTVDYTGVATAAAIVIPPVIGAIGGTYAALEAGNSMQVAIGAGDSATSPVHFAFRAGTRWLHATGNFFDMTVESRGAAGFARGAWTVRTLPIRYPAAAVATEGCSASFCITAVGYALLKGWGLGCPLRVVTLGIG